MRRFTLVLLLLLLVCQRSAHATPIVLRMATVAPDGTSWARELKAFGRDVESRTEGRVAFKWYWASIAGGETDVLARIKKGQLDGAVATAQCARLAPSLSALRIAGLYKSSAEALYVLGRLRPQLERELDAAGFFGYVSTIGHDVPFLRGALRSAEQLRGLRLWTEADAIVMAQLGSLGVQPTAMPIDQAYRAFEEQRIDGFVAIPTAALAFQWSTLARYVLDYQLGLVPVCIVISRPSLDPVAIADRTELTVAIAKLGARSQDLGIGQERELMNNLFRRQGLTVIHPDDKLRGRLDEELARSIEALRSTGAARVVDEAEGFLRELRHDEERNAGEARH
jgi:TRAP-type transport system periplasmic protein